MEVSQFALHSSDEGYVGYLHCLVIVNEAAINFIVSKVL
jgi:hypothetical protein